MAVTLGPSLVHLRRDTSPARLPGAEPASHERSRTVREASISPVAPTFHLIEPLADLAEAVGRVLSAYVAIHDEFFRPAIRRLIPLPGLFLRMDFRVYSQRLRDLHTQLRDILLALRDFREREPALAAVDPFVDRLEAYVSSLSVTISLFQEMSDGLAARSENARSYRWREYRSDVRKYDAAVKDYVAHGKLLNELAARSRPPTESVYPSPPPAQK